MVKPCKADNAHAKDPAYVCNPATGRWVKKSGKVGQALSGAKKPAKKVAAAKKPAKKVAKKPAPMLKTTYQKSGKVTRLSARAYFDKYGEDALGEVCKVSGKDKCLLQDVNGRPYWGSVNNAGCNGGRCRQVGGYYLIL